MRFTALAAWLLGALVLATAPAAADEVSYCPNTSFTTPRWDFDPAKREFAAGWQNWFAPCDQLERQDDA